MGENYSHLKRNGQFDNAKAFRWRRATDRSRNSRGLQQRMLWWNRNYKFKQQRASYTCKRAWKLQYHPTWYRKRSMLSVSNVWRDAGHETLTLDIDPKCMPDLHVAGIQYGWRRLRGIWGSTREKFCVGETNSPLSAVRRGAHNASTSWKGQREDAYEPDDNRCIQHLSIVAVHCWDVSTIYQMCRSTPIQLVCRCSNVGLFVSV